MGGAALKLYEVPEVATTRDVVERLRMFRMLRRVTAKELSQRIGKHDTYINKLELAEFNLPIDMFLRILAALGVSCAEFFAANTDTYRDSEIAGRLDGLSRESKEALLVLVQNLSVNSL